MRASRILLPPILALLAVPALSQGAEDAAAIEQVISDQLADFNARDLPGAWAHASPMIQGMFGTADNFGRMVSTGYPMVWTNSDATFQEVEEVGGTLHQKVLVRDAEGAGWVLDYEMVEVDGAWLINGVFVQPAPELSA